MLPISKADTINNKHKKIKMHYELIGRHQAYLLVNI